MVLLLMLTMVEGEWSKNTRRRAENRQFWELRTKLSTGAMNRCCRDWWADGWHQNQVLGQPRGMETLELHSPAKAASKSPDIWTKPSWTSLVGTRNTRKGSDVSNKSANYVLLKTYWPSVFISPLFGHPCEPHWSVLVGLTLCLRNHRINNGGCG